MVPTIHYFFWVRYHPNKIYSQKKSWLETKYRPLFPPTTKPQPLNPIDREPTSLVLARYRLVVLRSFCACFIIFCFCLPRRFCRSKLVLFRSDVCFCLISSSVSYCVCLSFGLAFLSFIWFLLLTLPAVPCFFSSCFFISIFTPIFLYKRIWAFVGQIMLTGLKGSWAQFVLICQNHSAEELYFVTDLYSMADLYSAANL